MSERANNEHTAHNQKRRAQVTIQRSAKGSGYGRTDGPGLGWAELGWKERKRSRALARSTQLALDVSCLARSLGLALFFYLAFLFFRLFLAHSLLSLEPFFFSSVQCFILYVDLFLPRPSPLHSSKICEPVPLYGYQIKRRARNLHLDSSNANASSRLNTATLPCSFVLFSLKN